MSARKSPNNAFNLHKVKMARVFKFIIHGQNGLAIKTKYIIKSLSKDKVPPTGDFPITTYWWIHLNIIDTLTNYGRLDIIAQSHVNVDDCFLWCRGTKCASHIE